MPVIDRRSTKERKMETIAPTESGETKSTAASDGTAPTQSCQVYIRLKLGELIHSKLEEAGCHLVREDTTEVALADLGALRDQLSRMVADRLVDRIQATCAAAAAARAPHSLHLHQDHASAADQEPGSACLDASPLNESKSSDRSCGANRVHETERTTDNGVARLEAELVSMRAKYDRLCATLAAFMPEKAAQHVEQS